MYVLTLALQNGPTIQRILENVPHSPAAIFVYLLLLASAGFVVRASRRGAPPKRPGGER